MNTFASNVSRFSNTLSPTLVLLKLGGSLITEKQQAYTPRPDVLKRLAGEILTARQKNPDLRLVLGHGAGSFGHTPAKKYGTRQGVHSADEWLGFADVWKEANALNRLVMDAMLHAGLPAISLPPSASVIAQDGKVLSWDLTPLRAALQVGLLPVVFGDVVFDNVRGGTILSTEDLFQHLARQLPTPKEAYSLRILLAGIEPGVWADFPRCTALLPSITPATFAQASKNLGGSNATDVTGGMASKVKQSLDLVQESENLEVLIFSGEEAGNVARALEGEYFGTVIRNGQES